MARPNSSLKILKYADTYKEYAAGEIVFREGDTGKIMYVVKTGAVELRVGGTVVERLEAGSILGEMALIDNDSRSATAIAATDCQLVQIDENKFTFLIRQAPYFAVEVMRIMACRLRRMNKDTLRITRVLQALQSADSPDEVKTVFPEDPM